MTCILSFQQGKDWITKKGGLQENPSKELYPKDQYPSPSDRLKSKMEKRPTMFIISLSGKGQHNPRERERVQIEGNIGAIK